ncbi:MAG: hypothetical protein AMS15_08875 [Planctomycetes bacterium DG_23]|nr:MAG: hypothetical protein AMS15_08875 [Planctomycetes bacterium DG_23]
MLYFIDESYRLQEVPEPKSTFAGIMIKKQEVREFERHLFDLKKRFYKVHYPHQVEIKGRLLLSPRRIKSPKNRELVTELISLCREHEITPFAVVTTGSITLASQSRGLPDMYQGIIWRANNFMQQKYPERIALPIFDGIDRETNRKISISFNNFMHRHKRGQSYDHILTTPLFVNSVVSPAMQIADVIAYCVNERYMGRSAEPELEEFFQQFRDLTFNYQDPQDRFHLWGIQQIPRTESTSPLFEGP